MEGETRGEQRKAGRQQKLQCWTQKCGDPLCVALCAAASLLCFGVCSALFVRTSELQTRILSLEQQRDAQLSAWMLSVDQVESVILGRLTRILDEVRCFYIIKIVGSILR